MLEKRGNFRRKTQEQFLLDCKEVHGDKYNYSKAIYVRDSEKVIITCTIHGDFLQRCSVHLQGGGCKPCNMKTMIKNKTDHTFHKALMEILFFYPHLDISKAVFTHSDEKIKVKCLIHNFEFETLLHSILKGSCCPKCGRKRKGDLTKFKQEDFDKVLEECKLIHKNKYDYSKIDISLNMDKRQTIICPFHGEFNQTLQSHRRGIRCKACSIEDQNSCGYRLSDWIKCQGNRKGKVYFVRLYDEFEEFYKVGITINKPKDRFRPFPYNLEIINIKESYDAEWIYKMEKRFLKMFKKFKYRPLKNFGGKFECFKVKDIL